MARIAIVSYWAPPQGAVASHRILRLSRALLAAGHDVHWVTLDRARLPRIDETLAPLIPDEITYHGLGGPCLVTKPKADNLVEKVLRTLAFKMPEWFAVPDGHIEWTLRLRRRLPGIVRRERIDVLYFCFGPHGALLALPKLRRVLPDVKILVDYRDLLSGNFWRESGSRRVRDKLLQRERRALAAADALFVNSADARERFLEVVRPPNGFPVKVMRNAADYELAATVAAATEPPDLGDGIHIGYFGTIFPLRPVKPILQGIVRLPAGVRERFRFHCFSPSHNKPTLDRDCADVGHGIAEQVVWHDPVPYGEALRAMQAMDALLLVNGATPEDRIFIPGKLFDYLMARRPVLFLGEPGDAWRIVADACGEEWCSRHSEPERLGAALERLAAGPVDSISANGAYGPERSFAPLLEMLGGP